MTDPLSGIINPYMERALKDQRTSSEERGQSQIVQLARREYLARRLAAIRGDSYQYSTPEGVTKAGTIAGTTLGDVIQTNKTGIEPKGMGGGYAGGESGFRGFVGKGYVPYGGPGQISTTPPDGGWDGVPNLGPVLPDIPGGGVLDSFRDLWDKIAGGDVKED